MSKKADGLIPYFILGVLAFIWGSSFILMKIGLQNLAPVELASLRVAIAGLSLSPFALRAMHKHRAKWKALIGVGLLGNLLPAILFANAQTVIDSSLSGMLNSLTAVFYSAFWGLVFRHCSQSAKMVGCVDCAFRLQSSFCRRFDEFGSWTNTIRRPCAFGNLLLWYERKCHSKLSQRGSFYRSGCTLPFASFNYFSRHILICR